MATSPRPQSTYATYIEYDIETGIPLFWVEEPYEGLWELAKKGRESQQKVTDQSLANAASDQATRQAQLAEENAGLTKLTHLNPNGLSDEAQSQYGSDLANIGHTYSNARQVGLRGIAQRGMAGSPTGAQSSLLASADRAQAADENSAYNMGLQETHGDLMSALNARQGLQQIYDPNAPLGTASGSAFRQSQMGSTLGDIGAGLSGLAGLATTPIDPASAAGRGLATICWVAQELWGTDDWKTHFLRSWILTKYRYTVMGNIFYRLYKRFGERLAFVIRKSRMTRNVVQRLFERLLSKALAEVK
jgi:hypothetical protein